MIIQIYIYINKLNNKVTKKRKKMNKIRTVIKRTKQAYAAYQ